MSNANTIENPKIYGAIAGVIADCGFVGKDKVNKQQGFKYRSVDDVFNALHPALAKNKVVIVPTVVERTCEEVGRTKNGTALLKVVCKVKYDIFAEDGSRITSIIYGEGMDMGDKATNKAMAIAYKYLCFQVFCIPTEEMSDPDAESLEGEIENQTPTNNQILAMHDVKTKKIEDMTVLEYKKVMNKFQKTPDLKREVEQSE